MKNLHLLLTGLSLFTSAVFAQSIEGGFNCKITGSTVMKSEEGKYRSYLGFKGGAKVNDETTLRYNVDEEYVYIEMTRKDNKADFIINQILGAEDDVERSKNRGIIISNDSQGGSISLLPDYIRVKNISKEFSLARYYKNDWHGMLVEHSPADLYVMVFAFNCRHTNDQLSNAYNRFK